MTSERIKEIQEQTAYPESVSVQQALLQVWNECEQESNIKIKAKLEEAAERAEAYVEDEHGQPYAIVISKSITETPLD